MGSFFSDIGNHHKNVTYFCYWDSKNIVDVAVLWGHIAVTICLLMYAVYTFKKIWKIPSQSSDFKYIFWGIMLWGITYIIEILFGTISYQVYLRSQIPCDLEFTKITLLSRIFFFLQVVPSSLLQILLFTVPFQMLYRTMTLLNNKKQIPDPLQVKKYVRLKRYRYFRFILFGSALMFWIPVITFLMIDCVVCLYALVFNRKYTLLKTPIIGTTSEDLKRLDKQTLALVISCASRIVLDCAYLYRNIYQAHAECDSMTKQDELDEGQSSLWTVIFIIVGPFLQNYLCILTIIRMYIISQDDLKKAFSLSQSLVSSGNQSP